MTLHKLKQDSESPKSKFEWWEILIGLLILCYVSLNIAVYRAQISRDELNKGDMVEVRFEGYTSTSLETHKTCVTATYHKNMAVVDSLIRQKLVFPLTVGTQAKVIEVGYGWCRFRLLSGKYNQVSCYYPIEWIRKR